MNGTCRACRDDSQCNASDACSVCNNSNCVKRSPQCCSSPSDCPGGWCYMKAGQPFGECGPSCSADRPCPPGQRCNAQGQCVPDLECSESVPCPPGKVCQNNRCVDACQPQAVYFDYNESRIRLDQQSTLNSNGDCIKSRGRSVRIEGHCDERGTEEYNLALGERRASQSKSYLGNAGVSRGSLRIISYGEERPTCTGSNESCWRQNRRAEFQFE